MLKALENGVSQVEDGAGRFPQVAGLSYAFDPKNDVGKRVRDVLVLQGGAAVPLDPTYMYTVVSNNYIRNGEDGYKCSRRRKKSMILDLIWRTVVAQYMAQNAPYQPYLAGRIVEK